MSQSPEGAVHQTYELPLTERLRTLLRLEKLFSLIHEARAGQDEASVVTALKSLIDVFDIISRIDVKSELVKELDRIRTVLGELANRPGVEKSALEETMSRLQSVLGGLKTPGYQPGANLRADELVTQVRQRIAIPGGLCAFDVPALHFWLHQPRPIRARNLALWWQDLAPIEDGCAAILSLLRSSTNGHEKCAERGFFQYNNEEGSPMQLVRVRMPPDADSFPEISGGKHRFTIRFLVQQSTRERPQQVSHDVPFRLQVCWL